MIIITNSVFFHGTCNLTLNSSCWKQVKTSKHLLLLLLLENCLSSRKTTRNKQHFTLLVTLFYSLLPFQKTYSKCSEVWSLEKLPVNDKEIFYQFTLDMRYDSQWTRTAEPSNISHSTGPVELLYKILLREAYKVHLCEWNIYSCMVHQNMFLMF